ncbi:MAG: hypothetical protein H6621_08570 [Halobacteriovoraceae bacterium]|nr:hypothetical protein [Halobacteriovoraceae bacterium]MCB9095106.1 hypothetical protein [Halobacteriovoraceae bacterium]
MRTFATPLLLIFILFFSCKSDKAHTVLGVVNPVGENNPIGPGPGSGGNNSSPEFQQAQALVFAPKCGDCHGADSSFGSFAVWSEEDWLTLSGGLVVPGSAETSPLIVSYLDPATAQNPMPPQGSPSLTSSELDIVKTWINSLSDGGGGITTTTMPSDPQGQRRVAAIDVLKLKCANCHTNGGSRGGFNLENVGGVNLVSNTVTDAQWQAASFGGNALVTAGDETQSYIYNTLIGSGGQPADMPESPQTPLNQTQRDMIIDWIKGM